MKKHFRQRSHSETPKREDKVSLVTTTLSGVELSTLVPDKTKSMTPEEFVLTRRKCKRFQSHNLSLFLASPFSSLCFQFNFQKKNRTDVATFTFRQLLDLAFSIQESSFVS
jgi:hypothetical protein